MCVASLRMRPSEASCAAAMSAERTAQAMKLEARREQCHHRAECAMCTWDVGFSDTLDSVGFGCRVKRQHDSSRCS